MKEHYQSCLSYYLSHACQHRKPHVRLLFCVNSHGSLFQLKLWLFETQFKTDGETELSDEPPSQAE